MEFKIDDMTCGHCVANVTKAIKDADPNASVAIDLEAHLVRVTSEAGMQAIQDAICDAGYTPRINVA